MLGNKFEFISFIKVLTAAHQRPISRIWLACPYTTAITHMEQYLTGTTIDFKAKYPIASYYGNYIEVHVYSLGKVCWAETVNLKFFH